MAVRRIFVEKKPGFDGEAVRLREDLANFLMFPGLAGLKGLRILNRYAAEGLNDDQFRRVTALVFSEPQCDRVFDEIPLEPGDRCFGVEYLPGQYDQRSDSAEQCAELVAGIRPRIRSARFYILTPGDLPVSGEALEAVKRYLINPVDSREASPEIPLEDEETRAEDVPVLRGFTGEGNLEKLGRDYALAMGVEDLRFCRDYFASTGRDPSLAELRVLDTYWSDHCRHTTFTTSLEHVDIADPAARRAWELYEAARREVYGPAEGSRFPAKPRSLMDMATIGAKLLKKRGLAGQVEESAEINACTIRIEAEFGAASEPWLLLFKNETHNHPTEIEPFGGAATCLGGAIRDPLSGRAYVYQAMRITGGADPREKLEHTLRGKLPQIKIAHDAAAGYSSYGNQIGLATGQVAEFYHSGFLAKRMELGAVIAAVPAAWVRREEPAPADVVILVGGKTGRDGIGGATGSSKMHSGASVTSAGAEVQKGNPVEERKLQRLFRGSRAAALIKRCNDFGAGGVSVAVGELAAGLDIDLDAIPRKYAGLNGIELAISESQERMAVVVAAADVDEFIALAAAENLDATVIAKITAGNQITCGNQITAGNQGTAARLRMFWRGKTIVDLDRKFLDSNGAPRSARVRIPPAEPSRARFDAEGTAAPRFLLDALERELGSLRSGSRRGLQERFDGSIGASSVLFPWGGGEQGTPECGMAALIPSLEKQSRTASLFCFGYDPDLLAQNPYVGAKGSVREALAKFACLGGDYRDAYLSLQEYFERPESPETWGKPALALLGALEAQIELGVPAIGGKDSMSGNYRDRNLNIDIAVPPTLVAFTAGTCAAAQVRSGALHGPAGAPIILLAQQDSQDNPGSVENRSGDQSGGDVPVPALGEWDIFRANMAALRELGEAGLAAAAYPVQSGGVALSLALMAFGNNIGVEAEAASFPLAGGPSYQGSVLVLLKAEDLPKPADPAACSSGIPAIGRRAAAILEKAGRWAVAGHTLAEPVFRICAGRPVAEGDGQKTAAGAELPGGNEPSRPPAAPPAEVPLAVLRRAYERPLAQVYPQTSTGATVADETEKDKTYPFSLFLSPLPPAAGGLAASRRRDNNFAVKTSAGSPLVVLPVFPGTNCEWDMERAFREAGARTRLAVFRNRNREDIAGSIAELARALAGAQILALSGGFSAGDEPDGSGKFIANVLRSAAIAEEVTKLLEQRDGLVLGICNGFQALIKLGLVPYGKIMDAAETMPTLSFNRIGRHVSRMVRTRVMSALSPWLALEEPGAVHVLPVSHGEGRLVIRREEGEELFKKGQTAFCYVDAGGNPTMAEPDNPNGSDFAIEGLCSPDGRILGKMAHSERRGDSVHINIPGNKRQRIFEAGVMYFRA
ncbi:MAG: phosphoribosylformylglycinamidine synthase subunit PurQ [Treponema sp.]|jgi:phosphoribosylformylglycinamidine synthase|nr:phosphoribosylformylglycinamidine synthase subunit PurQ [Treponema sp.]